MEDEILCNCMGISKNDIKNAVKNGISAFGELQSLNGVGSVCGTCEHEVNAFLQQILKESK